MTMLQQKRLVCFDLDGTLIDSVGIWNQVDAELIKQLSGLDPDLFELQRQRDQQLKIYREYPDPYLEYCGYLNTYYGFGLDKAQVKAQRYRISRYFLDNVVELKPHAEKIIYALKARGVHIALTTTTSLYNVQRYQENNRLINAKIDFKHDFDLLLTRENVSNIKPHPEVYLKALQHFNLEPEQCLIVEDSLIGVEAASSAGIDCIAVFDQYSAHELQQIKSKAHYFMQDFSEFLNCINDMP